MKYIERIIERVLFYLGFIIIGYILYIIMGFSLEKVPINTISKINYIIYLVLAIILFINVIINLYNYYYNKKTIIPVEFNLPNNITSCDAGYLYYKKIGKKQVVSLILYAASKGIFSLIKKDDKLYIKKNKEIPIEEELIIKKAFANSFDKSNIIEVKDFKMNGNDIINLCKRFYQKSLSKSERQLTFIYYGSLFVFLMLPFSLKNLYTGLYNNTIIIISIISGVLLLLMILLKEKNLYLNNEDVRKVLGYRLYLEIVEKEKLEKLFKDDSSEYYKLLSYAYALGVTDKWIDELKNIKYFDLVDINYKL